MSMKHIVFCTDFSENAESTFLAALDLAEKYTARLSVIHVMPPYMSPMVTGEEMILLEEPKKSLFLKLEERMQLDYGSRVGKAIPHELVVLDGHVSTEILRYVEENQADLVVLGAYGLSGMGLVIFGSVAKRVVHKAPCSVMIVRKEKETRTLEKQG